MCTFYIVPSLGPQSQVLHPAEASVFVQVSILSTRYTIDTHYKNLLHNYTSTMFPQERSSTRHRCPSPITGAHRVVPNTQSPGSRSEDQGKGSARPRCNLITNSHISGGNFQQARTITSYIPIPRNSLIVAIAYNKSFLSMGIKEYGKINGYASSSHQTQFGSVAYLASNA